MFVAGPVRGTDDEHEVDYRGAYGLRISGVGPDDRWSRADPSWKPWSFSWEVTEDTDLAEESIQPDGAHVRVAPAGFAEIDRTSRSTVFRVATEPPQEAWAHPYVSATAILNAFWEGWHAFHAGSFLVDGKVWALLGDREQGKSSSLAWLHSEGYQVFSDDLVILRESTVVAGPRCLDLRQGAFERYQLGSDIGQIGTRRRWRVALPAVPPEAPLGGWVKLRWVEAPHPSVRNLSAGERLAALAASEALHVPKPSASMLDLLTVPALSLERPRNWGQNDLALEQLVAAIAAS